MLVRWKWLLRGWMAARHIHRWQRVHVRKNASTTIDAKPAIAALINDPLWQRKADPSLDRAMYCIWAWEFICGRIAPLPPDTNAPPDELEIEQERTRSPVLDEHFRLSENVKGWIDVPASAAKMVAIADKAADEFRRIYPDRPGLPLNIGFTRMAIDAEKVKHYDEAITWCRKAKAQGWTGDWDKRIARCERRLGRVK